LILFSLYPPLYLLTGYGDEPHTQKKYFVNVEFTAYGKELLSKRGARQSKEESLDIK